MYSFSTHDKTDKILNPYKLTSGGQLLNEHSEPDCITASRPWLCKSPRPCRINKKFHKFICFNVNLKLFKPLLVNHFKVNFLFQIKRSLFVTCEQRQSFDVMESVAVFQWLIHTEIFQSIFTCIQRQYILYRASLMYMQTIIGNRRTLSNKRTIFCLSSSALQQEHKQIT